MGEPFTPKDMGINHIEQLPSGLKIELIVVEGGNFKMGGTDKEAMDREKPTHKVDVNTFYLGKYPVTQALWEAVMGNNPSGFKGKDHPVERVSWNETQDFLQRLNKMTIRSYRLPTEAEWEYAARGGNRSEGYLYSGSDRLEEVGWYAGNSGSQTHPVGQKLGNELGLCDMSGNVWEWVEDQWHDSYENSPLDGSAWVDQSPNTNRVRRGGSWDGSAQYCRVSYRAATGQGIGATAIGFRLAMSLQLGG